MLTAVSLSIFIVILSFKLYLNLHHMVLNQQGSWQRQLTAFKLRRLIETEISNAGHLGCRQLVGGLTVTENGFRVRYQALKQNLLVSPTSGSHIEVDKAVTWHQGQRLIISDCLHAETFNIAAIYQRPDKQMIITDKHLQYHYYNDAEVGEYIDHQYYIKDKILRRKLANGRSEKVLQGVDSWVLKQENQGMYYQFHEWSGYAAAVL